MSDEHHGPPPVPAGLADERFAVNVREMRERKKMSQGELARQMKARGWPYYQQTVRRVEEGRRKVSVGEAKALAEILGETVDRLTWPGREASCAALMDMSIGRTESAWAQIASWTATMLWSQGQLRTTLSAAESADYYPGSAKIREIAAEARLALEMTPEAAVETGRKDHTRMQAEGDNPYEDEDREAQEGQP